MAKKASSYNKTLKEIKVREANEADSGLYVEDEGNGLKWGSLVEFIDNIIKYE